MKKYLYVGVWVYVIGLAVFSFTCRALKKEYVAIELKVRDVSSTHSYEAHSFIMENMELYFSRIELVGIHENKGTVRVDFNTKQGFVLNGDDSSYIRLSFISGKYMNLFLVLYPQKDRFMKVTGVLRFSTGEQVPATFYIAMDKPLRVRVKPSDGETIDLTRVSNIYTLFLNIWLDNWIGGVPESVLREKLKADTTNNIAPYLTVSSNSFPDLHTLLSDRLPVFLDANIILPERNQTS